MAGGNSWGWRRREWEHPTTRWQEEAGTPGGTLNGTLGTQHYEHHEYQYVQRSVLSVMNSPINGSSGSSNSDGTSTMVVGPQ